MTSLTLVVAVTAFLSGAAAAVFLMLVIGIRKAGSLHRPAARTAPLDAAARTVLGFGNWPDGPAAFTEHRDD
jgi:hypothetical protein